MSGQCSFFIPRLKVLGGMNKVIFLILKLKEMSFKRFKVVRGVFTALPGIFDVKIVSKKVKRQQKVLS